MARDGPGVSSVNRPAARLGRAGGGRYRGVSCLPPGGWDGGGANGASTKGESMIRIAVLLALVVALVPRAGLVDAQTPTIIAGTVKNKAGKPLPGLALLEKGEIHNNVWDRGALVDPQGRFRMEVASAGQYGLHVYSSGYIYAPQAVKVEAGQTPELQILLVPAPTRANTPLIPHAGFFPWEAPHG